MAPTGCGEGAGRRKDEQAGLCFSTRSRRLYFALFKPLGFWVGSHLCENADWVLKSENRKRSLLGALDWQEAG